MERQITPATDAPETLELDVDHAGGQILFIGPATQFCRRLDIEVQVTLKTESGALDEQVDGVLRGYSATEAWLELQLHSPAFEIEVPPATDGPPPPPVAPLSGALSVSMTIMYQPDDAAEEDIDDPASYTLADTAELAAVIATFLFSPAGVEGAIDAWMYGRDSGVLRRTEDIATLGDP